MGNIYFISFYMLCAINYGNSDGFFEASFDYEPISERRPINFHHEFHSDISPTLTTKCNSQMPFGGYSSEPTCLSSRKIECDGNTLLESYSPDNDVIGEDPPDTRLFLFTHKNPIHPENLHDCGGKLHRNSNFNPDLNTEVFIHGTNDGVCKRAWLREMKDQVLIRGRYNVILVDWSWGLKTGDRSAAIENLKVAAEQVAFVLNNIIEQSNVNANKVHLIGFSLGAHGAGFVGKRVPGIRRITALDPSEDPYSSLPPDERLERDDALIVDVIHTSAFEGGKGFKEPLGDADFYPNGAQRQKQNEEEIRRSFNKLDLSYGTSQLDPILYNHQLSIQYYMSSINPFGCKFWAKECSSYEAFQQGACDACGTDGSKCAIMGMDFETHYNTSNDNHTYYLHTIPICPYCHITFKGILDYMNVDK